MKLITIFPLMFLMLISCASPLIKKDATNVFIEKTNLSKKDTFNRTISFLAKNLNNSNEAIQLKDASSGKIISKIGIECNELRAFADISSYVAYYTLEIDVKDNKIRITTIGESFTQTLNGRIGNAPMRSEHKKGARKCANRIKENLITSLKTSNSNW